MSGNILISFNKLFWTEETLKTSISSLGLGLGLGLKSSDKEEAVAETKRFPAGFKFGGASAAYQVEGHSTADGKGPNVWDDFTKQEGRIADGSSGDDGPDSYVHYKDDVKLLKDIGMQFYRFSISWSRVMADGTTATINEAGLQYYDNLINELLANDIQPIVTMYHWDLPSRLQDLGGFVNPLFPRYFEQYAILLYQRYGDRVKEWLTFNEPSEFCPNGYLTDTWAPGISVIGGEYYCAYHMLLAHARAYHVYKEKFVATQNGRIGISLNTGYFYPKDPNNADDVKAAHASFMFQFGIYAHPIFVGGFPEVVRENVDKFSEEQGYPWSRLPAMDQAAINYIKGTADFLGLNYYTSCVATPQNTNTNPNIYDDRRSDCHADPSWPRAKSAWLYSCPEGLRDVLLYIKETYNGVETIITENGWSDDGELEDDNRIEYLRLHLNAVLEAIEGGANVAGHTTWCAVDNFEWLLGFTEKFGIHSFDKTTKTRTPKKSVTFLKNVFTQRVLPEKVPTELFP